MNDILEVNINGRPIYFEVDKVRSSEMEPVGGLLENERIKGSFNEALDTIYLIALDTIDKVRTFDKAITPDEFALQFGVKLSGEYGAIVTKVAAEAQIQVTMTYKHKKEMKLSEDVS